MEALTIESNSLRDSSRGIKVSEFYEKDFSIGKYKFRWEKTGEDDQKLYVSSTEIFGENTKFLVKNPVQLIFTLAINTKECLVYIGEEGYEVAIKIKWVLEKDGPMLSAEE
ncbi:MAG: hypothetical protein HFJ47_02805 [Clostridia bacterium]|nr:hypothetical protein [Clostridia bacterium]